MRKRLAIPYNPWFLVPVLLWMVVGAMLLLTYSRLALFASVNLHYTPVADTMMYYATYMGQVEVIIPGLFLIWAIPGNRNWWYFATALACNIIPLLVQQCFKSYFDTIRPVNMYHHAHWIHLQPDWPVILTRSFPSGHSQGAFSFFCFLSLLLPAKYRWAGLLFFCLAISVCYSRLYLAAHFFDDVYAGSLIGTVATMLIFAVMTKYKKYFFKKDAFV